MKPIIKKQKIALFTPQGFLDGENAMQLITLQDISIVRSKNVSMVLISLKKVVFFNKNGIKIPLDTLQKLQKQMRITIGFCDYTKKQYDAFFNFFKNEITFSLFKTIDTAMLFAGGLQSKDENENVLLYNPDSTQRSMQAIEIYDRGYNPVVMQNAEEFSKRSKEKSFALAVDMTYLGLVSNQIAAKTRNNCVIYYLKGFLDGAVSEQFDITYHQNCLKVGFSLFMFDATRVSSLNIHAANFFSRLSTAGAEYGALIAIVGLDMEKVPKAFVEELEDAGIMFFDSEAEFFADETVKSMSGGAAAALKKESHGLTKSLISSLSIFVSSAMETLQMMTNMSAKKEEVKIQPFMPTGDEMMSASIAFYGDIDGMISLSMPKELVKKACALLIGEESDDIDVLTDALGELVNIVAGKAKTLLQNEGTQISITLPRSYASIEELKATVSDVKGVQVNFSFEDYPFTFYLNP